MLPADLGPPAGAALGDRENVVDTATVTDSVSTGPDPWRDPPTFDLFGTAAKDAEVTLSKTPGEVVIRPLSPFVVVMAPTAMFAGPYHSSRLLFAPKGWPKPS